MPFKLDYRTQDEDNRREREEAKKRIEKVLGNEDLLAGRATSAHALLKQKHEKLVERLADRCTPYTDARAARRVGNAGEGIHPWSKSFWEARGFGSPLFHLHEFAQGVLTALREAARERRATPRDIEERVRLFREWFSRTFELLENPPRLREIQRDQLEPDLLTMLAGELPQITKTDRARIAGHVLAEFGLEKAVKKGDLGERVLARQKFRSGRNNTRAK